MSILIRWLVLERWNALSLSVIRNIRWQQGVLVYGDIHIDRSMYMAYGYCITQTAALLPTADHLKSRGSSLQATGIIFCTEKLLQRKQG